MTRTIRIGRNVIQTRLTVKEIAERRADRLSNYTDQSLFLDAFVQVRSVAMSLARHPLDVDAMCTAVSARGPVQEAALIEALASLRAEGVQL